MLCLHDLLIHLNQMRMTLYTYLPIYYSRMLSSVIRAWDNNFLSVKEVDVYHRKLSPIDLQGCDAFVMSKSLFNEMIHGLKRRSWY